MHIGIVIGALVVVGLIVVVVVKSRHGITLGFAKKYGPPPLDD